MLNWHAITCGKGSLAGDIHSGLTPLGRVDSAAKTEVESVLNSTKALILLITADCGVVVELVKLASGNSLELQFEDATLARFRASRSA